MHPPSPRPVNGHRDLIVWQRAMQLAVECDRIGEALRRRRRYVLCDQLVRASVSIPTNIAEGQGRASKADNARHLAIARGSLKELDTLLALTEEIGVLTSADLTRAFGFADEVGRMLTTLIRRLGNRQLRGHGGSP